MCDSVVIGVDVVKAKRGRKSKKVLEPVPSMIEVIEEPVVVDVPPAPEVNESPSLLLVETSKIKKRGRKPKGGKIIQQLPPTNPNKETKPSVILHLKCSLKDLEKQDEEWKTNFILEPFHFSDCKKLSFEELHDPKKTTPFFPSDIGTTALDRLDPYTTGEYNTALDYEDDTADHKNRVKEIWRKLKQLEHNLHTNNINDKKSACFWCTHDFDNPPIYIPKYYIKDSYHVYGCFCSPECAVAHLMEENIDSSTKFERYHLMNHIYSKVYDYTKNIKPAPNPFYMLNKYYGNLSIQEYRSLLKNDRLFLIVDKPLTRMLPELHEDNEDFIINNKIIPSSTYQIKKRIQRKPVTKTTILNEKFGGGGGVHVAPSALDVY